ncbi:EAL domain-containing protein [Acidithiobacillus thiooxidans]|uniref:EAL domain-containing protein n=1 Tax=Acidithiobacillus thiooxidans TaxID=930 RepID=UPI0002625124
MSENAHTPDLTIAQMFLEQLRQSMQEALRDERLLLVGILDLDGFKQINDRWGHDQGDQLLCAVAQHLRDALRSGDIVARMGGDEFGLLLPNIRSIDDARNVADHLMQALKQSIPLDAQVVSISASLGFTVLPWDSGDNQQILRHADLALYVAKAQGRNQYCFYEAAMDLEQEHLMETLIMTQEALDDQRLVMYYQPIVTLPQTEGEISANTTMGKGIIGFEALMRLQDPQRGLLTPAAFCEALDHPRLARRIGCYVLDAVLAQGEHWHSTGLIVRLSLNISARHLLDSEFLNDLRCALKAHPGMPPEYCEIEVTESAPMQDFQIAHETLQQCNDLGLRIALDDFGTGNASLSYLQKLPAQTIKIDQSFVRDILNDPRDFAIVAGVTRTASMLGLEVIAEGVETLGHLQLLETLDHPAMQGYFFSRPMPAKAVPAWILSYNPMDYNVKPTQGHNNSAEMTDMGLLRAHNLRVEASIQYLRGQGDCLPDRIIGVDDVAHCHLAVWLDRFTNPATRPPEIDRLHRRLHQILTDNPSQPGSAEAQKLAQELQETNTRLMEELQMFLGERNVYGR